MTIARSFRKVSLITFLFFSSLLILSNLALSDQAIEHKFTQEETDQIVHVQVLIDKKDFNQASEKLESLLISWPIHPKLNLMKITVLSELKNDQAAIDYITKKVEAKPEIVGLRAARAQFLLNKGYISSAQKDFYYVYERGHRPVEVLSLLSDIEKEMGDVNKSYDLINQAIELDSEQHQLWFKKAQLELKLNKIQDAKHSSFKAAQLNSGKLEYHKLFIEILVYSKDKKVLKQYIEVIQQRFPDDPWLSLRLSTLYVEERDLVAAKNVLIQALKSNPNDHLLLFQMATILAGEQKWKDSLTFFKSGLNAKPDSTWAMIQVAKVYLQTGKVDPAVEYLETARELESKEPFVFETLARIYNRKNDTFEAERIILEGLSINEKNQKLILEYANILEKRGNIKETTYAYEEALKQEPNSSFILGKLGNLYRLTDQFEKSLEFLEKAISITPKSTWIRAFYIESLTDMKHYDRALSEITKLLEIMPDDYWAYAKRATIERERGKLDNALVAIDKSIELNPKAAWLNEIKGRILEGMFKYKDAETAFKLALSQDPDDIFVLTRLAYVQLHLDRDNALSTIIKSIQTDDFNIETIELYIYLSGLSFQYWGFEEEEPAYLAYQHIIHKQLNDADKLLNELEEKSSPHFKFLSYLYQRMDRDDEDSIGLEDINLESISSEWHFYYLAHQSMIAGDYEASKNHLEAGLSLANNNPWLMVKLSYVYQQLNFHEKAVEMLNKFLDLVKEGDFGWVQLRLALNYDLAKLYLDSERVYKEILKKKPDDNIALNNLAWMYLNAEDEELHKLDDALELAQKAVKIRPTSANLDTLAEAYFQKKDYEKALKTIERALDKDRRGLDDFKKTKKKILKAMEEEANK